MNNNHLLTSLLVWKKKKEREREDNFPYCTNKKGQYPHAKSVMDYL